MTQKEIDRTIRKAADKVKSVRADIYLIKFWGTILMLSMCAVLVAGVALQLFKGKDGAVGMVGFGLIIGAAVVILVFYIVQRTRGPLNYVEHVFESGGTDYIVQVIGKYRFIVSTGAASVEYNKGAISDGAALLLPECRWGFYRDAVFESVADKASGRMYTGMRPRGDKTDTVKLKITGGVIDYGEVNGTRIRYYDANDLSKHRIVLPDTLIAALKERSVPVPDGIILSETESRALKNGQSK